MNSTFKRLGAAALALCLVFSSAIPAFAEGFEQNQLYTKSDEGEEVYTVQVSTTAVLYGAEKRRAEMLELGFDSFILEQYGSYTVMCGKFTSRDEADRYCDEIHARSDRSSAYVTRVKLPPEARSAFESVYSLGNAQPEEEPEPELEGSRRALVDLALQPDSFKPDQYYDANYALGGVFTVQVSAHNGRDTAEADRDRMLERGFDSFVYQDSGMYMVMCGKFATAYEALCYAEAIHTDPDRYTAYVTGAYLPAEAMKDFYTVLNAAVTIPENEPRMETWWEQPTGAFFRTETEGYIEVYAVEFSQGTSFSRSESHRDDMTAAGYPAFCTKEDMRYHTLTGMFTERKPALVYCEEIKHNTAEADAFVTTTRVPVEELESFQSWYASR